jgi:replicative DNA helicase
MKESESNNNRTTRTKAVKSLMTDNSMEHGKLPPQAIDLEQAVLGAMMLEMGAVNQAIDILHEESFYKESHKKIYACIQKLFQTGDPIDILTVTNGLKSSGELDFVGGPYYISQLTNKVASTANIEFHARIIAQKYIQRELIRISGDVIKEAFEETTDVFDLLDRAENNLFHVAEGNIRKNYDRVNNVMKEAIDQIEAARKNTDGVSGIPSGFKDLDRLTSGWQRSDMIVIAARPAMGKTAFVLSMARNMAVDHNVPVAFFSLEMSSVQLVQRLIASETEISAEKLRKGSLEDYEYQQLHQRIGKLTDAPLFIDDTPGLSVFELRAKCRRLKAQHGIDMVIIDYLQLMTGGGDNKGGNREQEISQISRSIKGIAKELNIPIIALSQLSRNVENRGGDKRPTLSDLRESGAIEQDADIVSFIYRPEYYGFTEHPVSGIPTQGLGELIVAKHRNGAVQDVLLRFIGHLAKFTDLNASFDGGEYGSAMKPSGEFDEDGREPTTITVSSSMNDDDDDEIGNSGGGFSNDDVPF